jgi:hypothetical protein
MIRTVALCAALAGCVEGKTNHLAGTVDDPVSISARWKLVNFRDGATTPCPPGFDTAVLVAQAVDDTGAPTAPETRDRFACDDGVGSGRALTEHVYQVWIEISSDDKGLYARSVPQTFNVAKLDQPLSVTILNDAGYAQLAWQLVDAASGAALDCGALASPAAITVRATGGGASPALDTSLVCEANRAVTPAVAPGAYTFTVSARAAGMTVGSAAVTGTIADHNAVTDLGTITIMITDPDPRRDADTVIAPLP